MMHKLTVTLLIIPLLIVMAARNPEGMAHLVDMIITLGARLLNAVAVVLSDLLGGHPH